MECSNRESQSSRESGGNRGSLGGSRQAQSIVIAEYRGLDVASVTVLRKTARESGVYLRVLKNSLARRAVAGTAFEPLAEQLTGPLIYGISADPVSAAKVLAGFAKSNDKLVIKRALCPTAC